MTIPTLHTPRLVLRGLYESDIPAIQRNFEDYETVRFLAAIVPWPYPRDGANTWFNTVMLPGQGVEKWSWAICLREAPEELIGLIELFRKGRPSNRGFWLDRRFWGAGYMTEAVKVTTDLAFDTLGFERLIFDNAVGNTRSARLKESAGARRVKIEDSKFVDPLITQIERWELTKKDWQMRQQG